MRKLSILFAVLFVFSLCITSCKKEPEKESLIEINDGGLAFSVYEDDITYVFGIDSKDNQLGLVYGSYPGKETEFKKPPIDLTMGMAERNGNTFISTELFDMSQTAVSGTLKLVLKNNGKSADFEFINNDIPSLSKSFTNIPALEF